MPESFFDEPSVWKSSGRNFGDEAARFAWMTAERGAEECWARVELHFHHGVHHVYFDRNTSPLAAPSTGLNDQCRKINVRRNRAFALWQMFKRNRRRKKRRELFQMLNYILQLIHILTERKREVCQNEPATYGTEGSVTKSKSKIWSSSETKTSG